MTAPWARAASPLLLLLLPALLLANPRSCESEPLPLLFPAAARRIALERQSVAPGAQAAPPAARSAAPRGALAAGPAAAAAAATAAPPAAAAPAPAAGAGTPKARVCDISGSQQLADISNCTYLVADAAAAGQILYGGGAPPAPPARAAAAKAGPPRRLPALAVVARSRPPPAPRGAAAAGAQLGVPLFHEAGVWLAGHPGPYKAIFTSNRLGDTSTPHQHVDLSLIDPSGAAPPRPLAAAAARGVAPMANGGTLVPGTRGRVALICYQGLRQRGGGLAAVNVDSGEARVVVSSAGAGGGRFTSPNDVVVIPIPNAAPAADGGRYATAIFTDPAYGIDQVFRTPPPDSANLVWAVTLRLPSPDAFAGAAAGAPAAGLRWWPLAVGPARAVADGFVRPNGLAVSPDRKTLYISDTGYLSGGGLSNGTGGGSRGPDLRDAGPPVNTWPARPRAIYAYDLGWGGAPPPAAVLGARRLFAVADVQIPDGLRVDADGRLWSGEGDGVSVYEPGTGRLLLRVRPGDGGGVRAGQVSNFALVGADGDGFGPAPRGNGTLVMGQEQEVTAVKLPGLRVFNTEAWLSAP